MRPNNLFRLAELSSMGISVLVGVGLAVLHATRLMTTEGGAYSGRFRARDLAYKCGTGSATELRTLKSDQLVASRRSFTAENLRASTAALRVMSDTCV